MAGRYDKKIDNPYAEVNYSVLYIPMSGTIYEFGFWTVVESSGSNSKFPPEISSKALPALKKPTEWEQLPAFPFS